MKFWEALKALDEGAVIISGREYECTYTSLRDVIENVDVDEALGEWETVISPSFELSKKD